MQKKLLNFSIIFILSLSIVTCKVKNFSEEGLSPSDIVYLDKIDRQFRYDSLTKEEYLSKKVNLLLQRREYDRALNFYTGLDSMDDGYFKYPIEKRIMLNNIHILKFNKVNKLKERDSLINYMVKLFDDEQYNSRKRMEQNTGVYLNFISDKRSQMHDILWVYEKINADGSTVIDNGKIKIE
ncbi:MAG: hypothetical protein LBP34_01085 [Flavobacteriaceae bacterium]|jgi:hypothetical protein|nr:hypothetical protein [Flavobacteriaceae bacterium]